MDSSVPTSVTPMLTSAACVTIPPARICEYALRLSDPGIVTRPPERVMSACEDSDVRMIV